MKTTKKKITTRGNRPIMTKQKFDALTKTQQRVELAKDVIRQVEAGLFKPTHGIYFRGKKGRLATDRHCDTPEITERDVKEIINLPEQQCYCCAKGALVLSYVKNFNGVKSGDLDEDLAPLRNIFGDNFWDRIEGIFEWDNPIQDSGKESATKELSLVMKEIIRTNGRAFKEIKSPTP